MSRGRPRKCQGLAEFSLPLQVDTKQCKTKSSTYVSLIGCQCAQVRLRKPFCKKNKQKKKNVTLCSTFLLYIPSNFQKCSTSSCTFARFLSSKPTRGWTDLAGESHKRHALLVFANGAKQW